MNYPQPDQNPNCLCQGAPMAAFFCRFGHMLECHYPYDCQRAACSHLHSYGFDETKIKDLEAAARQASEGEFLYKFDELGNAEAKTQADFGWDGTHHYDQEFTYDSDEENEPQ